jgi:WD40 repeat protein
VAVAPDGTWLATASADGTVRIWDPTARQDTAGRPEDNSRQRADAGTPDDVRPATAAPSQLRSRSPEDEPIQPEHQSPGRAFVSGRYREVS